MRFRSSDFFSARRVLLALASLSFAGLLLGCSGNGLSLTAGGNNGGNGSGSMTATVAGNAWTGEEVQATWENGVLSFAGAAFSGSNTKQINVGGPITTTGTFTFGFGGVIGTYAEGSTSSLTAYTSTSGTLVVNTLTEDGATGTFSFSGLNPQSSTTIQVTNGVFDVEF